MPRQPMSPEERDAVRERILDGALALFAEAGFEGFSMRRLGARLDVAAKTVYNYFASKDEIYLGLLTRGFRRLASMLADAVQDATEPQQQLAGLVGAYVDFGLTHANVYNLMFTWHVPKFEDYVGTELEDVALVELETALESQRLAASVLSSCADGRLSEDDLRFLTVRLWAQMHGYVAGINNNLLDYLHPDPLAMQARIVKHTSEVMVWETARLAGSTPAVARDTAPPAGHGQQSSDWPSASRS